MKNKGFTLIELLAVIIILGILMLIAIPSVTNYINNSRKSTYITTVNELVKGTIAKVNSGDLNVYDTDTTYYVPCTCIKLENGEAKSPYGKFDPAYVVVTYDGDEFHYYFTGKDAQNMGVPTLTSSDVLSKESIVANVEAIDTSVGIEGTTNVYVFSDECNGEGETNAVGTTVPGGSSGSGGSGSGGSGSAKLCKRATTLHTETCNSSESNGYCRHISFSNGSTITYGNTTYTDGELHSGDAFDCDVNGDGIHDPETERFYYVSDYFDTHSKSFDNTYAAMIHYTSYYNGLPGNTGVAYLDFHYADDNGLGRFVNWLGPVTVVQHLPTTSTWNKVSLKTNSRAILSDYYSTLNANTVPHGDLPTDFDYSDSAARLITTSEIRQGCNLSSLDPFGGDRNPLHNCLYLFEGTKFADKNSNLSFVMVENACTNHTQDVWVLNTYYVGFSSNTAEVSGSVKPVIDVPKNRIDY